MYTVEFESDASIIITLDQKETHEDVEVVMADDGQVYLRQYEEEMDSYQMIIMSHQQWLDIMAAYKSTEGAYYLEMKRE
jgi:hypothetical protein|tara:strand:- start:114 stop:350 length:237 start_codon:yes stop_codon:yes gene_type:complete